MKRLGLSLLTAAVGLASLGLQTAPNKAPAPLSLEGVVRGPDGRPVENALVLARPTNSSDPPDSARTDASGRFKIVARKLSTHLVRVEAKGFAAKTFERVAPGKPLEVVLQKGAIIQGTVFDGRSAEPVEGARVEARSQDVSFSLSISDPSVGAVEAVTDSKGRFRLENVAPGLHILTADARGYGRASRNSVAAGGRADFYLFPGASITGLVRDAEDKPVAGAIVRAETDAPQRSGPPRAEVTSADGRFTIAGVEPGTYRLAVRHKDYASGAVTDVIVRAETEAQAEVVLSAGGRIVGRLLDPDGRPVKGRAMLAEVEGKTAARALADLLRAETDTEGRFRLASAPSGSHVLSLSAAGFSPTRVDVTVRDKAETDAGDIVLEAGLAIRGTVRTKAGAAIPEATVSSSQSPNMPPLTAQVEADGSFTLSGIGPGRQQLRAFAPGHAEARRQADAGADGIDFVLSPAGTIAGVVVDDAGQPVESFRVTARGAPPTGPNMPFSFASKSFGTADGRFSLDLGVEGPHVVEVAAPDHATTAVSGVAVVLGQTVELGRIRLSSGGSVRGQVVDPAGAPVAGATVTVRGAGRDAFGGAGPQGTTDVSGTFLVKGVTAGTVEAVASHPSFAEGRATGIEVDPSKGPAETRLVMTRGGRVEGSVRRRDGAGMPGMVVMLWPTQPMASMPPQVVTGEDGTFAAEHVRPGRLRATLMTGTAGRYTNLQDREIDVREGETTAVEFLLRDILLSGRVTRNGEPVPGLRLSLAGGAFAVSMVTGGPEQAVARGPQRMTATTDGDGRYEMLVNQPGKLRMTATSVDSRLSFPARMIDVPDVDAHVVDLAFGGPTLQGVVVDKESGQPIADARILAMLKKPQPGIMGGGNGTSGPDGRFEMELEPAEYRIEARAQRYAPASLEVTVGSSGAPEVRLALTRGAALEGRVVDERGRGIGGLNVFASIPAEPGENRPPPSSGVANSQPDGTFVVEGLQQQPHVVVVRSNIGSFAVQPGVSPGDRDVVLTLKPGGTLGVRALGPDGAPVAGAFVTVSKLNGVRVMSMGSGSTDAQGGVEFPAPAGELEVRVMKEKLQGTGSISVGERGAAALEVQLSEGPPKPRLP